MHSYLLFQRLESPASIPELSSLSILQIECPFSTLSLNAKKSSTFFTFYSSTLCSQVRLPSALKLLLLLLTSDVSYQIQGIFLVIFLIAFNSIHCLFETSLFCVTPFFLILSCFNSYCSSGLLTSFLNHGVLWGLSMVLLSFYVVHAGCFQPRPRLSLY